jgi:hypothetical protein
LYSYVFISGNLISLVFARLYTLNLFTNFFARFGWLVALRTVVPSKFYRKRYSIFNLSSKAILLNNFLFSSSILKSSLCDYLDHYLKVKISAVALPIRRHQLPRPISIHRQQITAMRRIRDNLRMLVFNKPKRA